VPLRFQVAADDRLAELAFGEQGIGSEVRIDAAQLRQPDRGRQVERRVVGGACGDHAFLEHRSGDELIFGHAPKLRYSPEPVNVNQPRFDCLGKRRGTAGPWAGPFRPGIE
jgi:hypothetical protein